MTNLATEAMSLRAGQLDGLKRVARFDRARNGLTVITHERHLK